MKGRETLGQRPHHRDARLRQSVGQGRAVSISAVVLLTRQAFKGSQRLAVGPAIVVGPRRGASLAWADPSTIKLTAKKQALPFTVESTSTFHKIKAKLPASLNGNYVRIDVSAKAVLGCDNKEGWLVKVADK